MEMGGIGIKWHDLIGNRMNAMIKLEKKPVAHQLQCPRHSFQNY